MLTKILDSRLKEFKSSGKDEKAFANYLQQSVAKLRRLHRLVIFSDKMANGQLILLSIYLGRTKPFYTLMIII